jgi:hypothetical protein
MISTWEAKPMSEIPLRGVAVEITSAAGYEFVVDATRAAEGLIDDATLMEKYELSPQDLKNIASNKALGRAIRDERERRVRNGVAAREAACGYFVKVPKVLDSIVSDQAASPRHRIEAAREIRQVAVGTGDDNRPVETERFIIRIDLSAAPGGEVEQFDAAIKINANDVAPDEQLKLTAPKQPKLTLLSNDGPENDE